MPIALTQERNENSLKADSEQTNDKKNTITASIFSEIAEQFLVSLAL